MKNYKILLAFVPMLILSACGGTQSGSIVTSSNDDNTSSVVSSSKKDIVSMQLSNSNGLVVKFDKKGARIESIEFEGKHIAERGFIAGRVANRIANAKFTLDGVNYNLDRNNGQHTLHGGSKGFGEIDWTLKEQTENTISFTLHSADKDQGFPGNLDTQVTYTLGEDGELKYEITAVCDKKTIFNPINHLYMNLNGNKSNANHDLWIDADTYTKTDSSLIPTGEIVSVEGTTLDYRTKTTYHGNNDSNLVLNGTGYRKVAEMDGKTTGYRVEVFTDRVGLQLYSDGQFICMENQDYPDAIHHDNFPSIVLEANEEYYSKSAYKFTKIS